MAKVILLIYGLLLLAGSYFGFKAGSKVSLVMGLVSGAFVLGSLWVAKTNPVAGFIALVGISGFLSATFLIRFIKTGKMMPSGMLLLMSLVALAVSLYTLYKK